MVMKDKGMRHYLQETKKFFAKIWKRFSNYNNSKKWFVLYLVILTVVLLLFPLVKIDGMRGVPGASYALLFSGVYWRSFIVIGVSLLFLLLWNISTTFKGWIVHFFSVREDEPLLDFAFLWIITSVFMGIIDTVGVAGAISERISLTQWASFSEILLVIGLVWSFVSLWISAQKTSKRAKILNIVEDSAPRKQVEIANHPKKPMQHLFDELEE